MEWQMTEKRRALPDYARIALAIIRLVNGLMALLTPRALLGRLGAGSQVNPVALYALRMFGIRTVLIGAGLLLPEGDLRAWTVRTAPIIHASDSAAAVTLAVSGGLPRRSGVTVVLISATNVVLSILAQRRQT